MAIVTTYICDITGKTGEKKDFVEVVIRGTYTLTNGCSTNAPEIKKLVHKDIALKLGIIPAKVYDNAATTLPEVTFEGKLKALLEDYVSELVQNHLDNQ